MPKSCHWKRHQELGKRESGTRRLEEGPSPFERHALAGPFRERGAIRGDCFAELSGVTLAVVQGL